MPLSMPPSFVGTYQDAQERASNRQRASVELSKLLSREFSTVVTPQRVLELFDSKWKTVSDLAHAIHNGRQR